MTPYVVSFMIMGTLLVGFGFFANYMAGKTDDEPRPRRPRRHE
jgi:hypothetical protein